MGAAAYLRTKVGREEVAAGRIHRSGTNTGTITDTNTCKYRQRYIGCTRWPPYVRCKLVEQGSKSKERASQACIVRKRDLSN